MEQKVYSEQCSTSPALRASHLLHVDLEGPQGLTLGTGARLHLLVLGLEEGAQHEVTLVTVVLHHAELGEHAGAAAHHAAGPDQLVQVELPAERGAAGDFISLLGLLKPYLQTLRYSPFHLLIFIQMSAVLPVDDDVCSVCVHSKYSINIVYITLLGIEI